METQKQTIQHFIDSKCKHKCEIQNMKIKKQSKLFKKVYFQHQEAFQTKDI